MHACLIGSECASKFVGYMVQTLSVKVQTLKDMLIVFG